MSRWYIVRVNPTPWTVPNVSVQRGKGGRPYPKLYKSGTLEAYQKALADELQRHYDVTLETGKIALELFFWREIETYKTPTGRTRHGKQADATNLQKSTEDALQGVLFENDSQVVTIKSSIVAQGSGVMPAVAIHVLPMPVPSMPPDGILAEINEGNEQLLNPTNNELNFNPREFF